MACDRDAALAALLALLDRSEPVTVVVYRDRSREELGSIFVPPAPLPVPMSRPDDDRDCRADILAVLRVAGRRMTTNQILSDLARRNWHHGERTVQRRLAEMVRDGIIDNDPNARPPGYAVNPMP